MSKLIVSPSPHQLGSNSVTKLMYGVLIALIPTFLVSVYFFGLGALVVTFTAVSSAILFEYLITKFILKRETTIMDGSAAITGLLLAFNVPSNLPIGIIIIGSFISIAVAKSSFGGLGNNVFNPALIGRVFMSISFPVQMTTWPKPIPLTQGLLGYTDVVTGETSLDLVQQGLRNGEKLDHIISNMGGTYIDMFVGNVGGSLGEVSAIAIIIGGIYMLWKKIITWHIPVVTIGTVIILSSVLWFADSVHFAGPLFHVATGGLLLGAVFMATDYVTSPMSVRGMFVYSVGIGILTIVIRTFGAFPEGVSFAILIMNAFVPIINMYLKPMRFGETVKVKKK